MKHILLITSAVAGLFLASCSGTKNLTPASLDLPDYITLADDSAASLADMHWWQVYTDSTLAGLIERVLANNPDLEIAAERIEQLRELYGIEKLNYAPTVTAFAAADQETNHYDGEDFKRDREFDFKASLNWEIDLWGGLSARKRASGARFEASREDYRAMQMSLIASTATAYFNLVALQCRREIVQRTLVTRLESVEKARLRYEGGLTSELVYQQAQVEYATAAAMLPEVEAAIDRAKNVITLLAGEYPGTLDFDGNMHLLLERPAEFPLTVSSALIQRRPDLRSAELDLRAASANVGVAWSDQFPRLRIGLTGGWENDEAAGLFKSPFSYIVGNISGTVLDFGRNRRRYKASIHAYEQARLAYERDVMTAFTEVRDAVTSYTAARSTADLRRTLMDAAGKYVTLATRQYLGGSISYLDVLDAYRRYFDAQISMIEAARNEYLTVVTLYKALGGGWTD